MRLSAVKLTEPNKENYEKSRGFLDRCYSLLPRTEDDRLDFYQVGRLIGKAITSLDEFKMGEGEIGPTDESMALFIKDKLMDVVDNPNSLQESAIAQLLLGSGLLPKLFNL